MKANIQKRMQPHNSHWDPVREPSDASGDQNQPEREAALL